MLQTIESINNAVNNFIWGVPAMICIIGVGLYLSLRTGFIQIRKFPYALKTTLGRIFKKKEASDGSMTPFQADEVVYRNWCDFRIKLSFDHIAVVHGNCNNWILSHNCILPF